MGNKECYYLNSGYIFKTNEYYQLFNEKIIMYYRRIEKTIDVYDLDLYKKIRLVKNIVEKINYIGTGVNRGYRYSKYFCKIVV